MAASKSNGIPSKKPRPQGVPAGSKKSTRPNTGGVRLTPAEKR